MSTGGPKFNINNVELTEDESKDLVIAFDVIDDRKGQLTEREKPEAIWKQFLEIRSRKGKPVNAEVKGLTAWVNLPENNAFSSVKQVSDQQKIKPETPKTSRWNWAKSKDQKQKEKQEKESYEALSEQARIENIDIERTRQEELKKPTWTIKKTCKY